MERAMAGRGSIVAAGLLLACGWLAPALAQGPARSCYEDIGCPWKDATRIEALRTLTCQNLAHVRNQLYHENGYCFHSKESQALYGNGGCRPPIQELVPLSPIERANIGLVRTAEREKGC